MAPYPPPDLAEGEEASAARWRKGWRREGRRQWFDGLATVLSPPPDLAGGSAAAAPARQRREGRRATGGGGGWRRRAVGGGGGISGDGRALPSASGHERGRGIRRRRRAGWQDPASASVPAASASVPAASASPVGTVSFSRGVVKKFSEKGIDVCD